MAMDHDTMGERPMAMTTPMPHGLPTGVPGVRPNGVGGGNGAARDGRPGRDGAAAPPTGLPPEQLYTWLEWVQEDLRRVEARLDYLEAARSQLREQERLLGELLASLGPLTRR
jgi:hypothetical protein